MICAVSRNAQADPWRGFNVEKPAVPYRPGAGATPPWRGTRICLSPSGEPNSTPSSSTKRTRKESIRSIREYTLPRSALC
jgi:hypothetical protein